MTEWGGGETLTIMKGLGHDDDGNQGRDGEARM